MVRRSGLDVLDYAVLLVEDTALEHVELHAVLIETERVTVDCGTSDADKGWVEELGVEQVLWLYISRSRSRHSTIRRPESVPGSMPRKRYISR